MKQALTEAEKSFERDEIPVGALVVANDVIIARAHNLTETLNDVTAHAEMQVITAAANTIGSKYLKGCTLYVSLEPCAMCAGAMYWAQIDKLVFGAFDRQKGYSRIDTPLLHPKTQVVNGIMAEQSEHLLKEFFRLKR